ncbi:gastrula zinc finger protein XlCGF52.1-like isoform X2 [Varanus komodoensis]|uniref:gastrula zinc finger protein XlCGF52.1-like isoform X2 n=1 Tax=Varanus komodoensis TaxID=61221 RepID=UPI001CF7B10B|nr:gastrula zinc finger protein XlCGF52.1-like isoform X2 [Varanus komodoensis]
MVILVMRTMLLFQPGAVQEVCGSPRGEPQRGARRQPPLLAGVPGSQPWQAMPPKTEQICRTERGDAPWALDLHRDGEGEAPGSRSSAGGSGQEPEMEGEAGRCSTPASPPWGAPGPDCHYLAVCPSRCEVQLTDVRSLPWGRSEGGWGLPCCDGLLICGKCGRSFADPGALRDHGALHAEGAGPFPCTQCGKGFQYRANLLTHKKRRGKRPHACTQCGAPFCLRGDLLRHRAGHTAEGLPPCGPCGPAFRRNRRLPAQGAEGAAEAPRRCADCGEAFGSDSELLRHQPAHEGDRPFACAQCGESFSWKESLQIHRGLHAQEGGFSCDACGKAFSRRGNLLTHQRLHSGELPFSCADCDRRFPSKAGLVAHGRLHRRGRPLSCPHCGGGFPSEEALQEHRASHSGPEEAPAQECAEP